MKKAIIGAVMTMDNDVSVACVWRLRLLDAQGKEVASKQETTVRSESFKLASPPLQGQSYMDRYSEGVGSAVSSALTGIVRDATLWLSAAPQASRLAKASPKP